MNTSIKPQQEQFLLTHWPAVVFLLHYAAGSLFSGCPGSETIVELVKYEIAKMVEQQDIEKILSTIESVIKQLKTIR
jgi:hypothetical protein